MNTGIPVTTDGRSFPFWAARRGTNKREQPNRDAGRLARKLSSEVRSNRARLFSDAERTEDQIQYVVVRSGASNGIQRTQRPVKIKQQHFMRHSAAHRILRGQQRRQRIPYQTLMPDVREEPALHLRPSLAAHVPQNLAPQRGNPLASQSRRMNRILTPDP